MLANGDPLRARRLSEESLDELRSIDDGYGIGYGLVTLGLIDLEVGEHAPARLHFQDALTHLAEVGAIEHMALTFVGLSSVEAAIGSAAQAAVLLGGARSLLADAGATLEPSEEKLYRQTLAAASSRLRGRDLEAAMSQGASMARDELIAYALQRGRAEPAPARA